MSHFVLVLLLVLVFTLNFVFGFCVPFWLFSFKFGFYVLVSLFVFTYLFPWVFLRPVPWAILPKGVLFMVFSSLSPDYVPKPMNAKKCYAVFVPVLEVDGTPHFLYQVRSKTMRRQPSEICFPGGKMEEGECATQAAVRELEEELGVTPTKIYGETDFLVLRSGSVIYPVVGHLSSNPSFTLSTAEVDHIFTVPISTLQQQKEEYAVLLEPKPQFEKEVLSLTEAYPFRQGKETFSVYRVEDYTIWGITGRITKHVLSLL